CFFLLFCPELPSFGLCSPHGIDLSICSSFGLYCARTCLIGSSRLPIQSFARAGRKCVGGRALGIGDAVNALAWPGQRHASSGRSTLNPACEVRARTVRARTSRPEIGRGTASLRA